MFIHFQSSVSVIYRLFPKFRLRQTEKSYGEETEEVNLLRESGSSIQLLVCFRTCKFVVNTTRFETPKPDTFSVNCPPPSSKYVISLIRSISQKGTKRTSFVVVFHISSRAKVESVFRSRKGYVSDLTWIPLGLMGSSIPGYQGFR